MPQSRTDRSGTSHQRGNRCWWYTANNGSQRGNRRRYRPRGQRLLCSSTIPGTARRTDRNLHPSARLPTQAHRSPGSSNPMWRRSGLPCRPLQARSPATRTPRRFHSRTWSWSRTVRSPHRRTYRPHRCGGIPYTCTFRMRTCHRFRRSPERCLRTMPRARRSPSCFDTPQSPPRTPRPCTLRRHHTNRCSHNQSPFRCR